MFVEGRIETTNWREITVSLVPFGLDMAENAAYSTNGPLFKPSVRWLFYFMVIITG